MNRKILILIPILIIVFLAGVKIARGSLSSSYFDFASKRMTNIATPIDGNDMVTKSYVDTVFGQ